MFAAVLLILWLLGFSLHVAGGAGSLAAGCGDGDDSHQFDWRPPRHGLNVSVERIPVQIRTCSCRSGGLSKLAVEKGHP